VNIQEHDDGTHGWSAPMACPRGFGFFRPRSLAVAEAMSALGMFMIGGLKAVSDIWGMVHFVGNESCVDAQRLTKELLERLISEKLSNEEATQEHVNLLYSDWQLPMYDFDLRRIEVSLEELQAEQEGIYWSPVWLEGEGWRYRASIPLSKGAHSRGNRCVATLLIFARRSRFCPCLFGYRLFDTR
jgi:hypothetical protein